MKVFDTLTKGSVINALCLVIVIVVVTIIKDTVVSMYRKRKDRKRIEGFDIGCGTGTSGTICDKLKYLLCNEKFNILKKYIDADMITDDVSINTGGRSILTGGGNIITMNDSGTPGDINTGSGQILAGGGDISGNIRVSGDVVTDNIKIRENELVFKNTQDEPIVSFGNTFGNYYTGPGGGCSAYVQLRYYYKNGDGYAYGIPYIFSNYSYNGQSC